MAKKKEEKPEEAKEEKSENIVEEEKSEEKVKEKDYNSIFDDDYDPDNDKDSGDEENIEEDPKSDEVEAETEPEEEVVEEEPEAEEEDEVVPEVKEEKPQKQEKKTIKKKSKGSSKKKILIALAILLALLLGAFGGYLYFKSSNKPKEESKPVETTTTTPPETKAPEKTVYITADGGLNMREDTSSSSKSLAVIPNGTKLTVLEEKDGWYKVEYNGQTGWVSKDFVSETKPADMKTYTGTGQVAENPKFSVKYPSDWTIDDYKISKTDGGKTYAIVLGAGGHGGNDDPAIVNTQEDVTVNGVAGKKSISKKDGKIVAIYTQFLKGDGYINIEFSPPAGYEEAYIDIYNKIVETFKFL
ncbi:MAG: SH3 domain-containing protein [bacterium]|nr:SH3 domain-containing protein [bacterium]